MKIVGRITAVVNSELIVVTATKPGGKELLAGGARVLSVEKVLVEGDAIEVYIPKATLALEMAQPDDRYLFRILPVTRVRKVTRGVLSLLSSYGDQTEETEIVRRPEVEGSQGVKVRPIQVGDMVGCE